MKYRKTVASVALALAAGSAPAAPNDDALRTELRQLVKRLDQLEADNRQLQTSLAEVEHEEKEEAMASRLEDMEIELLSLRKQARAIETVEGISAGAAMTMVAQNALTGATNDSDSQFNYRADISVTVPGGEIGDAEGHLFALFRLGQGESLSFTVPASAAPPTAWPSS